MPNEPKDVIIIVNGRRRTVPKNNELTVSQVVALAFDTPPRAACWAFRT